MILDHIPMYIVKQQSDAKVLFHASFCVSNHSSKKNNWSPVGSGRTRMVPTKKAQQLENELIMNLSSFRNQHKLERPIEGPLWVMFRFHYPNTKSGKRWERVVDLSNLIQGPEDALIKAGVIKDDKQIESYDGSRRVYGSPSNRLDIYIMGYDLART